MDCADRDRIDEARQELHRIINDREMRDAIILIFANKQDLPGGNNTQKSEKMLNRIGLACDCCDLINSATEILNFSSIFSHETARNSRKVGSYTDS